MGNYEKGFALQLKMCFLCHQVVTGAADKLLVAWAIKNQPISFLLFLSSHCRLCPAAVSAVHYVFNKVSFVRILSSTSCPKPCQEWKLRIWAEMSTKITQKPDTQEHHLSANHRSFLSLSLSLSLLGVSRMYASAHTSTPHTQPTSIHPQLHHLASLTSLSAVRLHYAVF